MVDPASDSFGAVLDKAPKSQRDRTMLKSNTSPADGRATCHAVITLIIPRTPPMVCGWRACHLGGAIHTMSLGPSTRIPTFPASHSTPQRGSNRPRRPGEWDALSTRRCTISCLHSQHGSPPSDPRAPGGTQSKSLLSPTLCMMTSTDDNPCNTCVTQGWYAWLCSAGFCSPL